MHQSPIRPISVRRCTTHSEYRACVDLQIAVWRFDPLDVVSSQLLVVAAETGGQIFGAFDGDRMIGFAQSFAAGRDGKLYLHSHMLAVLPEYQNRGIGRLLKMAQRDDALARGIDRIEWTFDPLQSLNAYFNVVRLGAIANRYACDFYGASSSPLHANLPTDRLVAEWFVGSPQVAACLAGTPPAPTPERTIAIPRDINRLRRDDIVKALEVQKRVRREFEECFRNGLTVTGMSVGDTESRYLLSRDASPR